MSKGGQSGGGQSPQQDTSFNPLWASIALIAVVLTIWFLFREHIIYAVYVMKFYQASFMAYFFDELDDLIIYLQTVPTNSVTFDELLEVLHLVGENIAFPYATILVIFAIILYYSNAGLRFRKTYNMKNLRMQEADNWPIIKPIVALDLINENIDKGVWAMALSPMEFAYKNKLLRRDETLANLSDKVVKTAEINLSDAKRVFTLQLGAHWESIEALQPYQQALFAIFAARINRDRKAANALLEQIALSEADNKLDFSGSQDLAKKYCQSEKLLLIYSSHAYVYTVMAEMLQIARLDGVLPTAEFLWLKPIDRRLWYTLNCVGRQTAFVEVAGIFAHYKAEKALKRRSIVPMVDEAVTGLRVAVKEIKLTQAQLDELEA